MKKILSTSEAINPRQEGGRLTEVCATGEAAFHEGRNELVVKLDSFQRDWEWGKKEHRRHLSWLPAKQTVREHLPREDASSAARAIFHSWTERIRRCVGEYET